MDPSIGKITTSRAFPSGGAGKDNPDEVLELLGLRRLTEYSITARWYGFIGPRTREEKLAWRGNTGKLWRVFFNYSAEYCPEHISKVTT